ncbi:MAG: hypothetical protein HOE30_23295 [Deltaproteobacteria bacterium]|nr:hypothetical protein [Deltaproteobacteria bacterium]MBT4264781.1 hypothetical protein [Deltaproteobacteria bacterium]
MKEWIKKLLKESIDHNSTGIYGDLNVYADRTVSFSSEYPEEMELKGDFTIDELKTLVEHMQYHQTRVEIAKNEFACKSCKYWDGVCIYEGGKDTCYEILCKHDPNQIEHYEPKD